MEGWGGGQQGKGKDVIHLVIHIAYGGGPWRGGDRGGSKKEKKRMCVIHMVIYIAYGAWRGVGVGGEGKGGKMCVLRTERSGVFEQKEGEISGNS